MANKTKYDKKRVKRACIFCKKEFSSYEYKSKLGRLGFVNVVNCYCSKKCEKAMNKAIRKCFKGEKLDKKEKEAVKNMRYVDI